MADQEEERPVKPEKHEPSGAATLTEETLQIFLRGIVKFMACFIPLTEAYDNLHILLEAIFLRKNTSRGMRPSVALAMHFHSLGVAASELKAELEIAKALATQQQRNIETHIKEHKTTLVLTAINNLYDDIMSMYPKIQKLDCKNDQIYSKVSPAVKSELEALDYPNVVKGWKDDYAKWLDLSKQTGWAAKVGKNHTAGGKEAE